MLKFIISVVVIATLLTANEKPQLEKVSLQLQWLDQFQFAGYYMAKEKGFYKDVGLDVALKKFHNTTNVVDEVMQKRATYGIGRSSLIVKKSEGQDIVLLSSIFQSSPSIYLAREDTNITTIEDFVGKKVMVTPDVLGSISLQAMLNKKGITADKYIVLPHSFNIDDLINKKTDLMASYISNEPFLLQERGVKYTIFDPKEYGFDFYSDMIFTSASEIKNHKKRAIDFKNASLKGWEYAFANIDETVELILQKYNTQNKSKAALLYEAKELKKLAYFKENKLGNIRKEKIQRIFDLYNILGYIKKPIDVDNFILKENEKCSLRYSKTELAYLKNKKELRVCVNNDWLPYEGVEDNKHIGLSGDFLSYIAQELGVATKIINTQNTSCDVKAIYTKNSQKTIPYTQTLPYFIDSISLVTRIEQPHLYDINLLTNKKLLIVKDLSSYTYMLKESYPQLNLTEVATVDEALTLVAQGKAFAYVGSALESSYHIQKKFSKKLKIVNDLKKLEFGFGIINNNPMLLNIFNKAIFNITQIEKQKLINRWANIHKEIRPNYTMMWIIFGVMSTIVIIILFFYNKQRRLKNSLEVMVQQRTDILDKQNIELKNLVNNFEELLDAAIETIIISDANNNIVDINRSGLSLFEVDDKKDVIGKNMLSFIPQEEKSKVKAGLQKESQESYELKVKTVKENLINVLAGGKDIKRDNTIIRISTLVDISNLKSKEKLLKQKTKEQDILLSLFDKGDSVLFKWKNDEKWSVEYVSKSVNSLLGYKQRDFISGKMAYISCIYKDDIQRVESEVKQASSSDKQFFKHEPYRVVTKSGEMKWVMDYTVIVKDREGVITHFLGYIVDITEQKQKQKQLFQHGKLAQMGDMISMIAHQWRQPLNAISATGIKLSLLSDMNMLDGEKIKESSDFIQNQCQTMSVTIDTFMNFVKPSQEEKEFSLEHSVDTVIEMIGTQLTHHNIKINIIKNASITLIGHEDLLEQVIINIISNAKDAFETHEESNKFINITISKRDDKPIITIQDNAGGIEESVKDRIFDPYFTTKEQGKGTGIGLYMSVDIMKKSFAGDIEYNATNSGSSFILLFGEITSNIKS